MVKPWHIIVLAVVLILLFGAKRLPDAARSLGRSLRIIKAETRGLVEDDVEARAEPRPDRTPLPFRDDEPPPLNDQPLTDQLRDPAAQRVGDH